MYQVIGTCSICGGRVTLPSIWHGVIPPVPTCEGCGGTKRDHGPVIEMQPRRDQSTMNGQLYPSGCGTKRTF